MIFRPLSLIAALAFAVSPALAQQKPLVSMSGQTRQLPPATTLGTQPSTTATASINVPQGTAPTAPNNGDIWSTLDGIFARVNGSTVGPLIGASNSPALNFAYQNTFAPGSRGPLFIWQNPSGTVPAGQNAGIQIWVGDNPTGTPGLGDTVANTTSVTAGNNRFALWAENLLSGRCGPAEGCPADHINGPTVGSEIDVYGSMSWLPANRAFNPSSGIYTIEGQQLYCQGPQYCTAGLSIWSTLADGSNWFREGIAMNRIANIGIHFEQSPGDTGTQLSVAAIQDDSNSASVIQVGSGTHANYWNSPNLQITGAGNARFGNQGEAFGLNHYVVVGGSSGNAGYEANINGTVGIYMSTDGASYAQVLTGAAIPLSLGMNNAAKMTVNAANVEALVPVRLPSYTVSSLPACNAGLAGGMARVSDATAPTYNGALTGGGAVTVPVFCNGSAWTSH